MAPCPGNAASGWFPPCSPVPTPRPCRPCARTRACKRACVWRSPVRAPHTCSDPRPIRRRPRTQLSPQPRKKTRAKAPSNTVFATFSAYLQQNGFGGNPACLIASIPGMSVVSKTNPQGPFWHVTPMLRMLVMLENPSCR